MNVSLEFKSNLPSSNVEISLSENSFSMSSKNIMNDAVFYEDACYNAFLKMEYVDSGIKEINILLNGAKIGEANLRIQGESQYVKYPILFPNLDNPERYPQPFLLQYDLVNLSALFIMYDGTQKEYFSQFIVCASKDSEDTKNIESILRELSDLDYGKINNLLFLNYKQKSIANNSIMEGGWQHKAYKSVSSYIQLIEEVCSCYKENLTYFRVLAQSTIKKGICLISYDKVRNITPQGFNWLMQNSDQLSSVSFQTAITYGKNYYLPLKMQSMISMKSWNIYENRIVLSFLITVANSLSMICNLYESDIISEEYVLEKLEQIKVMDYKAPIITVKRLQIAHSKKLLKSLKSNQSQLNTLITIYKKIMPCDEIKILHFPRKTKIFQEIKPYKKIFEEITRWYRYGEFDLKKEQLILRVKTLDKLFEYYCLYKLLKLVNEEGFEIDDYLSPAIIHTYNTNDNLYMVDLELNNTYYLHKGNIYLTIYYQPIIFGDHFENGITLFRTNVEKRSKYFAPDFVLKFSIENQSPEYIILDSKFSSRKNIREYHLESLITKYVNKLSSITGSSAIRMVWVLQGRMEKDTSIIWNYHNSPMSQQHKPIPSFGVASINTSQEFSHELWENIVSSISFNLS